MPNHRALCHVVLVLCLGAPFVVASDGGYSHAGIYGTFFYVDPNRELVIVILTQSIYGGNPGQAFIEAITDAVIEPSS